MSYSVERSCEGCGQPYYVRDGAGLVCSHKVDCTYVSDHWTKHHADASATTYVDGSVSLTVVGHEGPYAPLREILDEAYAQAADGKGKERHANDKPFLEQPLFKITDSVGIGFPMGQAMKKIEEAKGMVDRGQPVAAINEMLGAIVYLCATILHLKKIK